MQWSRSPRAWAEALDSNAALSQVRDEMERYNAREVWGLRCERCRIYCDIYDLEEILETLRAGVTLTRLFNNQPGEALSQQEESATDSCGAQPAMRRSTSKKFTLSKWSKSHTLCSEELLDELIGCVTASVKKALRVQPVYMRWIYVR